MMASPFRKAVASETGYNFCVSDEFLRFEVEEVVMIVLSWPGRVFFVGGEKHEMTYKFNSILAESFR